MSVFNDLTIYEEGVSNVTATNSVRLGDRRFVDGEEYVYCYNAGSATAPAGYGVKHATGATGYSVSVSSITDTANACVGVVKHADIPASSYGWVMTKGFDDVVVVSAHTGDAIALALGADGTFIDAAAISSAVGTGAVCAYALNCNTGAGGSVNAFVKTGF